MPRRVSIVSSTRADWGLLRPVARLLVDEPQFELSLVATGTHLSERFGMTVREIEAEGFEVAHKIPILEDNDDTLSTTLALSRVVDGFGKALDALSPDLVMVLGDRYEILGVVQSCLIARRPVAHLCGGDVTEGAFDDAVRHAVSKLSHLHFPTNADAGRRLLAMGEDPERVFVVGSTGLDTLRQARFLSRQELFAELGLPVTDAMILVTMHPETLSWRPAEAAFEEMAVALDSLGGEVSMVLTGSNADPAGRRLSECAERFASGRKGAVYRASLGQALYPSTMRHARAVVGNSSSGLYEAPSFGIATVNIGDRQKGRPRAASVIDVPADRSAIAGALKVALDRDFSGTVNPYGDGYSAPRIVAQLKKVPDPERLLTKTFHG